MASKLYDGRARKIGLHITIFRPRRSNNWYLRWREPAANGRPADARVVDRSLFPMELAATEVRLDDRRLFTGIVHDITERKRAEQQLRFHDKAVDASRQVGMAEIATGVLHNVGNVLNSVNVSASIMADKLRKSRVSNLAKAADLVREHGDDLGTFFTENDKGKKLPSYLSRLAEHLKKEQGSMSGELESLTKNIEYIKKIISAQQSHAGAFGIVESVSIKDVVEDAFTVSDTALDQCNVEVVRDYEELPQAELDRQRLIQIMVNLICNAKHALINGDCKGGTFDSPDRKAWKRPGTHRGGGHRRGNTGGEPDAHLLARFHDEEGRSWFRPAQCGAGGQGNGWIDECPQRRTWPGRDLHARTTD